MKRLALALLALSLPFLAAAQVTTEDLEKDLTTRTSVHLDYRILDGFHAVAGYEIRTEDNLSRIDRHQATLGLTYKITDWLKAGADYTYIYRHGSSAWEPRHRFSADLTFSQRLGDWRLSYREQLRLTHKTAELNRFQEVRNALWLKSRLKMQYKGWRAIEPYGYVELRHALNDPSYSATWNAATQSYTDYSFGGYNAVYMNRLRGTLGFEWTLSPHHSFDIYYALDYYRNKAIDTNKAGTKLKSVTWKPSLDSVINLAYTFSF